MWNDVPDKDTSVPTAKEVLSRYEDHPRIANNPLSSLNTKERAHIRAEIEGIPVSKLGFKQDKNILNRPKVVQAVDEILNESGLTDRKLAIRLRQIIFKGKGANADNNAHNAIRTVFQLKGKFAPEKHEVLQRSDLANLTEDQLDMIIKMGVKEYTIAKVKLGEPSPPAGTPPLAP